MAVAAARPPIGTETVPETATSHNSAADYDVRDPVLTILLAVQAGVTGNLTAWYRIRRLIAEGWR